MTLEDPYHWFMVIIVFIPCLIYLFAQSLASPRPIA